MHTARSALLTGAAALLKVSCGSDDLVWLAPFIAREKSRVAKLWVSFLYAVSVVFLVSIAAGAGYLTQKWWLQRIAGSLLILYSLHMAYDEKLLEVESTPSGNVKRNNIVVVALLGSLDDFTVYLIMAGSGIYTWYELILGTFLGCAVLASIVLLMTESSSLSHVLSSIPAWLILFALGIIVLADLAFFIHPFPGKTYRGVAPLSAACVASGGFFSLLESDGDGGGTVAQVSSPATVEGLGEAGSFDLRQSIPCARLSIKKKPSWMATQGSEGLLGVAVSDMVVELNDVPAGPGMEEDPLSEDWSIIREAPVKSEPPAMPRVHPRYELWIETSKELSKLGRYHFSFDNEEAVLSMSWVNLPGFPLSLAVGTGVNTGEDLTCRGRLMLFTIKDKEPGILPPVYQRSLRSPVTVVGQSGSNFIHAEGFKLYVEKWENSSFNKLALFDGSLCMTSMSNIKNFMLFGDLRKGVDFCQWKEEQSTGTRTIRRLSRSPPSMNMTVLACEFVIHQKSLGLVALDHKGNVHLYQYTPHSDGREGDQILRSCATFAMGAPCRSALRLQTEPGVQSLLMASGTGEVFCCRPIDDQAYRTITTLLGMLFTRLPFRCGLNPRAYRSDAQINLLTPRKNIEDAVLLKSFAFLSQPLQNSIAEKMRCFDLSPGPIDRAKVRGVGRRCSSWDLAGIAPE
eukprot:s25_g2.t4